MKLYYSRVDRWYMEPVYINSLFLITATADLAGIAHVYRIAVYDIYVQNVNSRAHICAFACTCMMIRIRIPCSFNLISDLCVMFPA